MTETLTQAFAVDPDLAGMPVGVAEKLLAGTKPIPETTFAPMSKEAIAAYNAEAAERRGVADDWHNVIATSVPTNE